MTSHNDNAHGSEASAHPHRAFQVMVGDAALNFQTVELHDPMPTGRQILNAAGASPAAEHLVFQWLTNGPLKELGLDDTVDIRPGGVEKFLIFQSDRSFRLLLDDHQFEWGTMLVSGLVLKKLAKVNIETYGVWLEIRGGDDRKIADAEQVDLSAQGVERFFTGIVQTTEG